MAGFPSSQRYIFDISPWENGIQNAHSVTNLQDLEANAPFDFVILSHVLEHAPFPLRFIQQFLSVLADDAFVYIEVPLEFIGAYLRHRSPPIGAHVNLFSSHSLTELATRAELRVISISQEVSYYGEMRMPVIKLFCQKVITARTWKLRTGHLFWRDLYCFMKYRISRRLGNS